MGKKGPCYHCGVTSTPLWRNGPPDKPVLCNACGSRWRTKGTLANYTPLHARADFDEYEDQRVSKVKAVSLRIGDPKLNKRKVSYEVPTGKRFASNYKQGFLTTSDEDTSYRSSSGSALSNSDDSFVQLSSADTSDLTDPSLSPVWEAQVPSKKRTSVVRVKTSPVEKFIRDLHAILQEQQSSCVSGSSEEDLLIESDVPMVSVEIGHGSVLMKHPSWRVREEDSEASSLSFENKPCTVNEAYSNSVSLSGSNGFKGGNITKFTAKTMQQEPAKRDNKFNYDRMQHFATLNSPLCHIDLNDVVNFEALLEHFTSEEQQELLKYLPSDDTSELPGSLKNMFDSSCFKENLSHFQQLLSDGVFSNNYSGAKAEDFKNLKKLAVSNFTKSNWMESYSKLKDIRSSNFNQEIEVESGSKLGLSKYLLSAKRPLQEQNLNMPGKGTTEGPKRGLTRFGLGSKAPLERGGSFFPTGSLFRGSNDGHCISPESCQDECSDQDLLLDVPSNGAFPEAELLFPPSSITSRYTSASSSSMHLAKVLH